MEANTYLSNSLNDIIFEGRNKAYGAYELRLLYPNNLLKATFLSLNIMVLFLGFSYYAVHQNTKFIADKSQVINKKVLEINLGEEYILEKAKPPTAPAAPVVEQKVATTSFREPRIVTDVTPISKPIPNQSDFSMADPGLETGNGEIATGAVPGEDTGTGGSGSGVEESTVTKPFNFVEVMPEYEQGGQAGMNKFISKSLRFPRLAQEQGLEGTVIISFVVSPTGEITSIEVLRDFGGGAGEEAVRVISKMPKWKPGYQNNRAVPVRMTLPIRFTLQQ